MPAGRFLSVFCLLAAYPAAASTFNIAPIRAELTGAHRTFVLTLTNAEDHPVVVQIRLVAWSQRNGEEQLDETRDVLVTPPVAQLGANSQQVVRVALRREPDPSRELTYRVLFEEVPQAAPANFNGLQVALRLSIPVFVAPAHAVAAAALTWDAHRLPDGAIEVAATNHGTGHLQVSDFELQSGLKDALHGLTSKYVLPGSRVTWTVKSGGVSGDALGHGALVIHGHSDQGDFSADASLSDL